MSVTTTQLLQEPPVATSTSQRPLQQAGIGRSLAERVVCASEAHCTACPPLSKPNEDIASIPVSESEAFPEQQHDPQPAHWNTEARGNPPFRPLNRNVDFSIRPLGANGAERTFLIFMLSGVMIQNWANVAWRSTIGKLNTKAFTFKLGGTW